MSVVLACDLGSTSFRAAVIDARGECLHLVFKAQLSGVDRSGASEVDPSQWWEVLGQATDELARDAEASFNAVEAIAISGVTRSQVFLGADNRVLRPAITWRDSRAERCMGRIRSTLPPDHPETPQVNAFHPAARLGWLRLEEPMTARALAAVIEPKDYLNLRLTGECRIDRVGSARLVASATGTPGASVLEALGYSPGLAASPLEPTAVCGHVQAGLPGALGRLAGRPVLAMGTDSWASCIGLGALREGYAYNLSGTTEVLGLISAAPARAEGLLTVDWGLGLHQIGGPSQSGADTLVWLLRMLGHDEGDPRAVGPALDALLAQPREKRPLLFLPYLQGERTPHWDEALRGAFVGLHRNHGTADCAHAALEGVAFLNRLVLHRAEDAVGRPAKEIRFGGGGAASPVWCQVKSDICERSLAVVEGGEPGLVGAAIVAFAALGHFRDIAAGQEALVRVRGHFTPRPAFREYYRQLYDLYREADEALAPISRRLSAFPCEPATGEKD
ncbi:MAG: FGGY-family carbohydrate kinase [Hyphomicrobiales bacterium]